MILGQLVVIDAIDDGQIRAFRRRRDEDALRARLEMGRRLLTRGENARAFERDVDAERLVRKLGRILDRRHLDLVAVDHHRVALDLDLMWKAPMDTVVAQEVRVRLHGTEIVDGDDLDVLAARLQNPTQHQPPNPAEAIDRYLGNHRLFSCGARDMAADASLFNLPKPRLLSDPQAEVYRHI